MTNLDTQQDDYIDGRPKTEVATKTLRSLRQTLRPLRLNQAKGQQPTANGYKI